MAATALAVLLPSFHLGIPSGHDFEFHMNSWMEVLQQWKLGILYPRWAALAHYGFGEPRFIFYPPLSWMLGAALGSLLPWAAVPFVHQWIALALSGCFMFLLARDFLPRREALFTAALYTANPYYIVIVYWRSDFAELLAGAFLPLLLLYVLRSEQERFKSIVPLGLILAVIWLTNLPSAVLATYSLGLLSSVLAIRRRSLHPLFIAAAALVLALALSAFYVLPAANERKWVEIAQAISPGVRPQDNFLFTNTESVDHNLFNRLVSLIAVAEIVLLALAAFLARSYRPRKPVFWWLLVVWGGVSAVLMLRFSFVLYLILPELQFIQLTWRWLLCLNVPLALLVTLAFRRWSGRAVVYVVMIGVLLLVSRRVQPPWWDTPADVAELLDNQNTGAGYEGTDEYAPKGADPYEINRESPRVAYRGPGNSRIRIGEWAPQSRAFSALLSQPGALAVELFPYPAWKIEINGRPAKAGAVESTGQMLIPVEAGESQVRLRFVRTPDRVWGASISLASGILMLVGLRVRRRLGSG